MPEKRKTILEDFLGTECSGCGRIFNLAKPPGL